MTKALDIAKGNGPQAIVLRMMVLRVAALALMAGIVLGACAGDDDNRLEIIGSYEDDYGILHEITQSEWSMDASVFTAGTSILHIASYANANDYLIGQNDSSNAFNADLFDRIDWTTFNSQLYFCTSAFAQATADDADAAGAGVADSTDPSNGGCGGFSWSRLDPVPL